MDIREHPDSRVLFIILLFLSLVFSALFPSLFAKLCRRDDDDITLRIYIVTDHHYHRPEKDSFFVLYLPKVVKCLCPVYLYDNIRQLKTL